MNNNSERLRELIVKEVDELTTSDEKLELKSLLNKYPEFIQELNEQKKMKEVSKKMKLKSPPQEVFDSYWMGVYNRIERGIGWIIFSVGAVILITYGLFKFVETLISDSQLETIVKIGIIGVIAGIVIIFVSVIREKLTIRKTDKYKEVQR
ncbi:MAG: hypothetical protein KJ666_04640 [Bacteroidetes bacterium]|nr:hypothetical protein [Bacteroidota bacterium]MBU2585786.1 hypothetical protein [Bacteroidota bacterium]